MKATNPVDAFREGAEQERQKIAVDLFEQLSHGKISLMQELMRRADDRSRNDEPGEWKGYSEGMRHALNIVRSACAAKQAYDCIVNRSMDPLTGETNIPRTL